MKLQNYERVTELIDEMNELKSDLKSLTQAYDKKELLIRFSGGAGVGINHISAVDVLDYTNENLHIFPHNLAYYCHEMLNKVTDAYEAEIESIKAQIELL